jgi:DNA repair exonuclease SbcCD nuclease subunit
MSKILIFSDLHAHPFKPYATLLESGVNSRLQDAVNIVKQIRHIAETAGVDMVLFGGDMFHVRKNIPVAAFNMLYQEMAQFSLLKIPVVMIHGNHDQADRFGEEYSIYAFGAFATVIDKPGWVSVNTAAGDRRIGVLGVPYLEDLDQLRAAVDQPAPSDIDHKIFLGHFGVQGAMLGADFVYQGQYDAKVEDFAPARFDASFLGHFHLYQKLPGNNAHFIGAPMHHTWGDKGQTRGCLLYDTDTMLHEQIRLTAPQFIELTEEDVEEADAHGAPPCSEDNYVKIFSDHKWTESQREEMRKHFGWRSLEFVPPKTPKSKTAGPRLAVEPTMGAQDVVSTYVQSGVVSTDGYDEGYLLQLASDVMQEVESNS